MPRSPRYKHVRFEIWAVRLCHGCGGLSLTRNPENGTGDPLALDAPCIECGTSAREAGHDLRDVMVEWW